MQVPGGLGQLPTGPHAGSTRPALSSVTEAALDDLLASMPEPGCSAVACLHTQPGSSAGLRQSRDLSWHGSPAQAPACSTVHLDDLPVQSPPSEDSFIQLLASFAPDEADTSASAAAAGPAAQPRSIADSVAASLARQASANADHTSCDQSCDQVRQAAATRHDPCAPCAAAPLAPASKLGAACRPQWSQTSCMSTCCVLNASPGLDQCSRCRLAARRLSHG